jgi:hypothetical protein
MTQLEIIKKQVDDHGFVSRNWCLAQFITRLGARICDLEKQGYEFTASYEGSDYVYRRKKEILTDEDTTSAELNAMIDEIIKATPVSWENKKKLDALCKARKGDDWQKRSVIGYYSQK